MTDGLDTAVRVARRAVGELDAADILDALWLATRLTPRVDAEPRTPADTPAAPSNLRTSPPARERSRQPSSEPRPSQPPPPSEHARGEPTYALDLPYRGAYASDAPNSASPRATLAAGRAASPLADRLGFYRALRPLKRNAESSLSQELDEDATVQESASTGYLIPSMRPNLERWLDLDVVVDVSPTMTIWRPTLRRFKHLLLNAGVFRRTRFWSWDTHSSPEASWLGSDWPPRGRPSRQPTALATSCRRRLVLVVTDAISEGWHTDLAARAVQLWSHQAVVVLLPMLPARMWARTGLANAEAALIEPATPATPSKDLICSPRRRGGFYQRREGRLRQLTSAEWKADRPVVPVTALQPHAFARLARFVAGHAAAPSPGLCLPTPTPTTSAPSPKTAFEPEDAHAAFRAFRAGASPSARNLARYLAALGYFSPEVVRLVRETLVPEASVADEAEVLLSGLARVIRSDPNPERVIYAYPREVRETLRGEMTVQASYQVLQRVFAFWASAAGFADDSLELLIRKGPAPSTVESQPPDTLAAIAAEVLRDIIPATAPAINRRSGIRQPRVHINYELEQYGQHTIIELPFVVGVIADLSGSRAEPLPPLDERRFIQVHAGSFDSFVQAMRPSLRIVVPNRFADDQTEILVDLAFRTMQDFQPEHVAAQVYPLAALLENRAKLNSLLHAIDASPQLEEILGRLLRSEDSRKRILASTDDAEPTELDSLLSAATPNIQTDRDVKADLRTLVESVSLPMAAIDPRLTKSVKQAMAQIDLRVSQQLAEIMHHPDFQRLEGTWRGLHHLVRNTKSDESLFIRVLNASKEELSSDLGSLYSPYEQNALSRKIHDEAYGMPGGTPFGVLISDFAFSHQPDDLALLRHMGGIARRSSCPFVASAAPALFGVQTFSDMDRMKSLPFESAEYGPWQDFRRSDDSRFVALGVPRVLARMPYTPGGPDSTFDFEELSGNDARDEDYCWMSAAWTFGVALTRAFENDGWCVRICGIESGGAVRDLPVHAAAPDVVRGPTDYQISARMEKSLSDAGLLPLSSMKNTNDAVFFSAYSLHWPESTHPAPRAAARLSDTFATSRFLQYIKTTARDRVGSFTNARDLERWLQQWINRYVDPNPDPSTASRAERPLKSANIVVRESPEERTWIVELELTHNWGFDHDAVIGLTATVPGPRS